MTNLKQYCEICKTAGNETQKVLKQQYDAIEIDIYKPAEDEIINGLLGRNFRFLYGVLLSPPEYLFLDICEILVRSMLEGNIYLSYLLSQDDPKQYLEFKKYGISQEKKYKSRMIDYINQGKIDEATLPEGYIAYLDSDVDKEEWDELIQIKLKNFENLRKLAEKSGNKFAYDTIYDPFSSTTHGHYNALVRFYLKPCKDPLHRHHYVPKFDLPKMSLQVVDKYWEQFLFTYDLWSKHYGLDDRITPIYNEFASSLANLYGE